MARSASKDDFELIVQGVSEQKTPGSALNKTSAALALYGYRKAPGMSTVTHPSYGKLFLYEFKATPFGDLVLTVGGSVWPSLEKTADLPIASGVPGRFAVAAEESALPASSVSAVSRGQKTADRWEQRFESPPAVRAPARSASRSAPVHIVHERAPEVEAEVVYGRGMPEPEPEPVYVAPPPVYVAPPAAKARQPRAPRAVAAPAPAAGGGGDAAFLAAMQSLISQM